MGRAVSSTDVYGTVTTPGYEDLTGAGAVGDVFAVVEFGCRLCGNAEFCSDQHLRRRREPLLPKADGTRMTWYEVEVTRVDTEGWASRNPAPRQVVDLWFRDLVDSIPLRVARVSSYISSFGVDPREAEGLDLLEQNLSRLVASNEELWSSLRERYWDAAALLGQHAIDEYSNLGWGRVRGKPEIFGFGSPGVEGYQRTLDRSFQFPAFATLESIMWQSVGYATGKLARPPGAGSTAEPTAFRSIAASIRDVPPEFHEGIPYSPALARKILKLRKNAAD